MVLSVYKKGQGTAARGVTAVVLALMGGWAAHQAWYATSDWGLPYQVFATALVAFLFGGVPLYLVLFHHQVGDLLIETQQEMRKVAWSSRSEVMTSTVVVVVTVVLLALFIYVVDHILLWLATIFGVY